MMLGGGWNDFGKNLRSAYRAAMPQNKNILNRRRLDRLSALKIMLYLNFTTKLQFLNQDCLEHQQAEYQI